MLINPLIRYCVGGGFHHEFNHRVVAIRSTGALRESFTKLNNSLWSDCVQAHVIWPSQDSLNCMFWSVVIRLSTVYRNNPLLKKWFDYDLSRDACIYRYGFWSSYKTVDACKAVLTSSRRANGPTMWLFWNLLDSFIMLPIGLRLYRMTFYFWYAMQVRMLTLCYPSAWPYIRYVTILIVALTLGCTNPCRLSNACLLVDLVTKSRFIGYAVSQYKCVELGIATFSNFNADSLSLSNSLNSSFSCSLTNSWLSPWFHSHDIFFGNISHIG